MPPQARLLEERFWEFVVRRGPLECWLWIGPVSNRGYGQIYANDATHAPRCYPAHVISWEFKNGKWPQGMQGLHSCDTPLCVNPDHTRPGTGAENHEEKVEKRRHRFGKSTPWARLTEDNVRSIRTLRGKQTSRQIACAYGVGLSTVKNIFNGKNWKHLDAKERYVTLPNGSNQRQENPSV